MVESASVMEEEVRRFDALGQDWWNPSGPMAPLHRMNPIRLAWLLERIAAHFGRTPKQDEAPLENLEILDIGCGAGLLSEPLFRLGARVIGLDPAPTSIAVARAHALETGAEVVYRQGTIEEMAQEPAKFDVVLALEVVEHVKDLQDFLLTATSVLRPGGLLVLSTLNRTLQSFALAIVTAEYVLHWLEPGTHRWEQFVTPAELKMALKQAGMENFLSQGLSYNPLSRHWSLSKDCNVNYFSSASKPRI